MQNVKKNPNLIRITKFCKENHILEVLQNSSRQMFAVNKIAKRMLPMAVRLVRLWFEHADVEQTVEPFEDQVQQL